MIPSDNIIRLNNETPKDLCKSVAEKVRLRRLELNLTQKGLAVRAGVNIETYRRFERTGEISFLNIAKLSVALDMSSDLDKLFTQRQYESLDELLAATKIDRKRGKRL